MAEEKGRKVLLEDLIDEISKLKEASEETEPSKKNLNKRIKCLKDSMAKYEAYHYKQSSEEENPAAKNELKKEFMIEMRKADLVLYPAEDLFDTLVGSDEDFVEVVESLVVEFVVEAEHEEVD